MLNGEREIILTLEKIFNWQSPSDSTQFTIAFYSLKTSALILQRTLTASPANSEMVFNYSLKITYLSEENEVLPSPSRLCLSSLIWLEGGEQFF